VAAASVRGVEETELQALLDRDDTHWWYRGRLRIVLGEVERLELPRGALILDAGCGSGHVLAELGRAGEAWGIDASPRAVAASRRRGLEQVIQGRIERLPYPDASFRLVTCLDVIEHLDDDVEALRELRRVTAPGGHLVVTVPAYPSLWSRHDELNHHRRRYVLSTLGDAAARAGWQLERASHFNTVLLPPAALVRVAGRSRLGERLRGRRSELSFTPRALDLMLELPLQLEAALIRRGVRLPAGLSLLATFRRPAEQRPPLVLARRNRGAAVH